MKKGQITIYVLLAVIIISAIGIVLYTQRELLGIHLAPPINEEIRPVNTFVESCLKSTAEDALIFVGQQGGYYDLPYNSIDEYVYYFAANKSYFPKKETIENEISKYINEMLPFCTQNFASFSDFQISANPSAIKTETKILDRTVKFNIKWPCQIKKSDSVYNLNEFSIEIPSRLNTIYNVAGNMTSQQLKDFSSICLSCLTKFALDNDLYINMEDYDETTVLFIITDDQTQIKNQPYEFIFANKY